MRFASKTNEGREYENWRLRPAPGRMPNERNNMSLMSPSWIVFYTRYGIQRHVEWPFPTEPKSSDIAVSIRNNPGEEEFLIPDMPRSATPDESAIKFFELNNISDISSHLAPEVDPYQS